MTIDINPIITKFNANSAQFRAGTAALGLPVTVTDTDASVNIVESGGSFTCTASATSSYITFTFGNTVQTRLYQRMQFDGSFTAEYTPPGNISSYTVYINNVAQVGFPMAFNAGDELYIEVTETVPGGGATLRLTTDGITNPIAISALDYFITRDMSFQENVVDYPDKFKDTDQAQQGTGNTTNYLTNFIGDTTVSGDFDMIIEPNEGANSYNVYILGLNDGTVSNTVANRYPRMAYSWFINPIFTARVYEFGVSKFIMPNDNATGLSWFKIEGRSGTIKYYKSTDNRATWSLIYTSLTAYTTQNYNSDFVNQIGNYGIFKPQRLAQQ